MIQEGCKRKMGEIGFQYFRNNYKYRDFSEMIKVISGRIKDATSREIFFNRLLYSLTDDPQFMKKLIINTKTGKRLNQILDEAECLYIYGAGRRGKRLVDLFPEKKWKGYYDEKQKGYYRGLKIEVLTADNIVKNSKIVISNYAGYEEIKESLKRYGCREQDMIILGEFDREIAKDIYFPKEIIASIAQREGYFIDAGGYDGKDTIHYGQFFDKEKNEVHAIVFEPDKVSYEQCVENLTGYSNVEVRNTVCASGAKSNISFRDGKGEGSFVDENATETVEVDVIDVVAKDKKIAMIKMDVEGMELEALRGAAETIKTQTPVLAISIYHKREDIWEIPDYILSLNDNYIFYLSHYTVSYGDTVLYAIKQ